VSDGAFRRVLVGWKNTRETRRAIADALPLLQRAEFVLLAEIAQPAELSAVRERLAGVANWAARHDVEVETLAVPSDGQDALALHGLVIEHGMDLLVAGAYGHSRVREWVLGGVTRDLLLRAKVCALVSH
jgi:nucleotide-binding universal stress UspA family protein